MLRGEYDGQFIKYIDLDIMKITGTTQQDLNNVVELIASG